MSPAASAAPPPAPEPATRDDDSPARALSTPVDGVTVLGAISPSRAQDFLNCPLAFRFRTVDRLPEPPSHQAVRGTLVHAVLDQLFDLPAPRRTPTDALALLGPAWDALRAAEPGLEAGLETAFADSGLDLETWLASCVDALEAWFSLEDPRRLEPAAREVYVEDLLESRLLLRGFIDRVDVAPDGAVRIVDYKSGKAAAEGYEQRALFQMRFYALVWWRLHGVLPRRLQLVYLGSGEIIRHDPDEDDLLATQRKVEAIWAAMQQARADRDWQPRRSPLCGWCSFKPLCPEWGGTPPPLPEELEGPRAGG